ncbi:hypothetical protein AVEN_40006-1 [Araneus ventricosus]|uniref:Uncharacterized protein n=1 Tax=Araneus ventricosus TaxID=182803 RepID=A0A4Y2G0J4_ARAVE|nr:hypothetical protein AVEN_40006-1 [Araneus ventricosus]
MVKRFYPFRYSHGPFPSYLYRFRLHSDISSCGEKGEPLHYSTSCHLTSSFHFIKPSVEGTLFWWKNLLLNKLPRIKIALSSLKMRTSQNSNRTQPVHPTPTQIYLLHQDLRLMDPDPLEVQCLGT